MKRSISVTLAVVLAGGALGGLLQPEAARRAVGAAPGDAAVADGDGVVAVVNGKPITLAELQRPLMEAYGLKILVYQVQLNLAKQKAAEQGIQIGDADYTAELDRTLKVAFEEAAPADYPALLDQLLDKKGVSRAEWDMVIQTNAVLRKIAEPVVHQQIADKITEDKLKDAFNALYGETVVIRHIQCANPQDAQLAKNRLAAGERFENVVRAMSQNFKTRELEGELPQFSRQTESWGPGWGKVPPGFKQWAFGAKVGEISDVIQAEGSFHVLKLDRRNEPKVMKFDDDMKRRLRDKVEEKAMEQAMNELRFKLAKMSRDTLVIKEPTLRKQYQAKVDEQEKATKATAEERAKQDLLKGKTPGPTTIRQPDVPAPPAGTNPNGTLPVPDVRPSTGASPTDASTGERPPATKSAAPGAADPATTPQK